jgi:hypothetical protein
VLTQEQKDIVKECISLQVSLLGRYSKAKCDRMEKLLTKLGFTEEEVEGAFKI